jgi:hypothetical protein
MKRVIAAAGLALAMASTAACGAGHTSSPSTVTVTAAPPAQTSVAPIATPTRVAQPPAELGQWVTDGSISFNVCQSLMGGTDLWLIMWIKNVGSRPQTYSTGLQRLTDDRGRVFAPDLGPVDRTWTGHGPPPGAVNVDLNPDATAQARLDFVIPEHTDVGQYRAELHESLGSPGAVVQLQMNSLPNCD